MIDINEVPHSGTLVIDSFAKNPNVSKDSEKIEDMVRKHIPEAFCYMKSGIKVSKVKRIIGVSVKICYSGMTPELMQIIRDDLWKWGQSRGDDNGVDIMCAQDIHKWKSE